MLVFEERATAEYLEENQPQTNPHVVLSLGIDPKPHKWEASALTTVPSLLPITRINDKGLLNTFSMKTAPCQ